MRSLTTNNSSIKYGKEILTIISGSTGNFRMLVIHSGDHLKEVNHVNMGNALVKKGGQKSCFTESSRNGFL